MKYNFNRNLQFFVESVQKKTRQATLYSIDRSQNAFYARRSCLHLIKLEDAHEH